MSIENNFVYIFFILFSFSIKYLCVPNVVLLFQALAIKIDSNTYKKKMLNF